MKLHNARLHVTVLPLPLLRPSPYTLDRAGVRVYFPPRNPLFRVCQSPNQANQSCKSTLVRPSCALPLASLLLVLGQPCPRLPFLHQMPTSTFSPICIAHESLALPPLCCSRVTRSSSVLLSSFIPHSKMPSPWNTFSATPPWFCHYSALQTSVRSTSTEPYPVRLAVHKRVPS